MKINALIPLFIHLRPTLTKTYWVGHAPELPTTLNKVSNITHTLKIQHKYIADAQNCPQKIILRLAAATGGVED